MTRIRTVHLLSTGMRMFPSLQDEHASRNSRSESTLRFSKTNDCLDVTQCLHSDMRIRMCNNHSQLTGIFRLKCLNSLRLASNIG